MSEHQFSLWDVCVLALILIMGCLCLSINSHYGMFVFEHQFSLWDVCVLVLILIMGCLSVPGERSCQGHGSKGLQREVLLLFLSYIHIFFF